MKRHIKTAIKWLVSLGLISYLLKSTDLDLVKQTLTQANIILLIFALLLCFLGYFISSNRWKTLMGLTGKSPPIMYLVQSFMVSIFFNNLLPSTIGGDASRTVDTWRVSGNKAQAFAIVFLDRFFGVYALFIYASLGYFYFHNKINIKELSFFIIIGLILASIFIIFIIIQPVSSEKLGSLIRFLPVKIKQIASEIIETFYKIASNKKAVIRALALSFLLQVNVVLHYFVIAQALHIDISFMALFMIIPIALIVMMAPISVNGIGLREAVFVVLLGIFGVNQELAISFSFVVFLMIVVQGILGGLMYLYRKSPQ